MKPHFPESADAGDSSLFPATVVEEPARMPDVLTSFEAEAAAQSTTHIGRYALKRLLARGGLGTVHEAWDPLLSRPVAIKTLHLGSAATAQGSLDGLILQEARTAAALNHRGIVTIYDAGMSSQGVYVAMEKLHGQDLRTLLQQRWQPTPVQAAALVRRVADALAYAHGQGVVHCDVKPGNIFITRNHRPKLLDFGIARATQGAAGAPRRQASAVPWVAGSPHYVAPEQMGGGGVDARSDVYALGAVLYELLAGRKAFAGATLQEIQRAVRAGPPAAPHRWRAQVPAALSRIAMRALAWLPEERFASAADFSATLRSWMEMQADAGESPGSTDPGLPRRRWSRAWGWLRGVGGQA